MEPGAVGLFGGLLFLLIAVVGGGFTIKEIAMPAVPNWARVASLAIGAALVVPYFARHDTATAPTVQPATAANVVASAAAPKPATGGARRYVYRPGGTDISPESIELFGLQASGPNDPPRIGDRIDVRFTLRNDGSAPVTFAEAFVAARAPDDDNRDFGAAYEGQVLTTRATITVSSSIVVDRAGLWDFWPCYDIKRGTRERGCPDGWRSFQVDVAR
jgi:hypothetical protein